MIEAKQLAQHRAETITNTELAFAYNQGAHAGVMRAISQNLMGRCAMVWTTAGTNRVCSRCLALKDTVVGYTNESGVTLPPLHPRCRCAISYREVGDKASEGFIPPSGDFGWHRQQHFSTSDENIKMTNPNFHLGAPFQNNCQKCVPAYEMRMRGYNVVARPTFDLATDGFAQNDWDKAFEGAVIKECFIGNGKSEVVNQMKAWGDGARGEVYVVWEAGGAHVFVAENRNGEIHFSDPQNGELDTDYYFNYVKDGLTKIFRIDNLEPNRRNIKWCCKEVNDVNIKRSDKNC